MVGAKVIRAGIRVGLEAKVVRSEGRDSAGVKDKARVG